MGDTYLDLEAMRKRSKEKRAHNRENSALLLQERGIQFESKNGGAHLIVTHNGKTVDFWPGTGKFVFRRSTKHGRGVKTLISALGA
jgi:hypothetical protein